MKKNYIPASIIFMATTALVLPVMYAEAQGIQNPIAADNLQCFVLLVFKTIINIAGFVAVGFFIWTGFKFVQARGNPDELKEAKQMFVNTIIGTILIFGAWVFAEIITRTINDIAGRGNMSGLSTSGCDTKKK